MIKKKICNLSKLENKNYFKLWVEEFRDEIIIFKNDKKIKKYRGPLLIIHAEQDHIIPFSQGKELLELCPSKNKKLIAIPNANHNNILGVSPQIYFEEVTQFINALKKG